MSAFLYRIVLHVTRGRLDETGRKARVEQARVRIAAGRDVTAVTDPFGPQSAALSRDGRTADVGVLSAFIDVPDFSLILCMMVGLGVGIDYALFVVTRHRQHLHDGMSVADAAGMANATAGMAVLFAGSTVVIAILGLHIAGIPAISSMGAAVALIVVASMIAAVT